MQAFKNWLQIVTLIVALFQLVFSDRERALEHLETTEKILKLTEVAETQNAYIEAAFRGEGGE